MPFTLPDIGDCIIIAGNPRSGKTQFAKWLFKTWGQHFGNQLVFQVDRDVQRGKDPARPWEDYCEAVIPWKEASPKNILDCLRAYRSVCVNAYDCEMGKTMNAVWGNVCMAASSRGNTLVVNDEIARVSNVRYLHPYHYLLVTGKGSKRHCSMVQATQTPQTCSVVLRDNAAHQVYFRLDERVVHGYLDSFLDRAEEVLSLPPYWSLHKTNSQGGRSYTEKLKPCPLV